MEIKINIRNEAGEFAENKDTARRLRTGTILPALRGGGTVEFDFAGVRGATQSFVHALVAEALRRHGDHAMDSLFYKNCNAAIKEIIKTVYEYMQESLD